MTTLSRSVNHDSCSIKNIKNPAGTSITVQAEMKCLSDPEFHATASLERYVAKSTLTTFVKNIFLSWHGSSSQKSTFLVLNQI